MFLRRTWRAQPTANSSKRLSPEEPITAALEIVPPGVTHTLTMAVSPAAKRAPETMKEEEDSSNGFGSTAAGPGGGGAATGADRRGQLQALRATQATNNRVVRTTGARDITFGFDSGMRSYRQNTT